MEAEQENEEKFGGQKAWIDTHLCASYMRWDSCDIVEAEKWAQINQRGCEEVANILHIYNI